MGKDDLTRFYNIDAERRLIHALFSHHETQKLIEQIEPEDFFEEVNQRIVRAVKAIAARGGEPDFPTLLNETHEMALVTTVTSYRHASDFEDRYKAEQYVSMLRELRRRRDALKSLQALCDDLLKTDTTVDEVLAKSAQAVAALERGQPVQQDHSLQGVLERTYEAIVARADGSVTTVSCGIPALDELTGGLFPGEMTVIGARPGTGKTALTLQIAERAAMANRRVVFVSREMSDVQIGERILARHGVHMARSRIGRLREDDWETAQEAMGIRQYSSILVDNRSTTVTKVRTNCRRWAAQGGLDLVCIDYLQLIHPESTRGSRNDQVAEISWAFKELAIELNVPVLLLSQLNRDPKGRSDPTPQLTDLRDSGSIEQDADNVWLLYCPASAADPDVQALIDMNKDTGRAVVAINIAKARQSVLGTVYTQFIKDKMTFVDTRPEPLPEQMTME